MVRANRQAMTANTTDGRAQLRRNDSAPATLPMQIPFFAQHLAPVCASDRRAQVCSSTRTPFAQRYAAYPYHVQPRHEGPAQKQGCSTLHQRSAVLNLIIFCDFA